jgi:hypothetical protein
MEDCGVCCAEWVGLGLGQGSGDGAVSFGAIWKKASTAASDLLRLFNPSGSDCIINQDSHGFGHYPIGVLIGARRWTVV